MKGEISHWTPCQVCGNNYPVHYGEGSGFTRICPNCAKNKNSRHLAKKIKRLNIGTIKDLNRKSGQYWFSPDTVKFFKSKFPEDHVGLVNNQFFISSEKSPYDKRKYSIRKWDGKRKGIDTVGEFGGFNTKSQAERHLQKLIKGMMK